MIIVVKLKNGKIKEIKAGELEFEKGYIHFRENGQIKEIIPEENIKEVSYKDNPEEKIIEEKIFLDVLKINLTKDGLKNALKWVETTGSDEIEFALEEGFEGKFLNFQKLIQFYSQNIVFSENRYKLIEKIKEKAPFKTGKKLVYPIIFMFPLALKKEDLHILEEGGFELLEKIEKLLSKKKNLQGKNLDDFLSNEENQAFTLCYLAEEIVDGNLSIHDVFWFLLISWIADGYFYLKKREKPQNGNLN